MNAGGTPFAIRHMQADDAALPFRSGVHALDHFFKKHAAKNHASGLSRVHVLMPSNGQGENEVAGFLTLSMDSIDSASMPDDMRGKLALYPAPVLLVGRLAVATAFRGRGFGAALLRHAIQVAVSVSDDVGCMAVVTDAKDAGALAFYQAYGFQRIPHPRRQNLCLLPLATLKL